MVQLTVLVVDIEVNLIFYYLGCCLPHFWQKETFGANAVPHPPQNVLDLGCGVDVILTLPLLGIFPQFWPLHIGHLPFCTRQ